MVSISPSAHHQGLSNTQQQLAPRGQGSRNPSFQASNERFTPPTGQENRPYRQHQDDHDKALRSQGFVKSTPPRTHATPPHQQRLNGGSSSGYSTPRTSYLVNSKPIIRLPKMLLLTDLRIFNSSHHLYIPRPAFSKAWAWICPFNWPSEKQKCHFERRQIKMGYTCASRYYSKGDFE